MKGGTDPYLCQADAMAFEGLVVEHAGQMKCLTTSEALAIAHYLRRARQDRAITLLMSIGSDGLAQDLLSRTIAPPEQSWLAHFCEKIGVSIMTPSSIESARRHSCSTVAIEAFFDCFSVVPDRDPALIVNCDETHVSSRKKFKVLAPDRHLP
jgi:hypothetical protein